MHVPVGFMDKSSEHERHQAALAFLFARIDYERTLFVPYGEREFRLEGMRDLLSRLGDPQERFAIVHVAGTASRIPAFQFRAAFNRSPVIQHALQAHVSAMLTQLNPQWVFCLSE